MSLTVEEVQKRLEQLQADRAEAQVLLAQLQSQIAANAGAIQDCEFWLQKLAEADPETVKD